MSSPQIDYSGNTEYDASYMPVEDLHFANLHRAVNELRRRGGRRPLEMHEVKQIVGRGNPSTLLSKLRMYARR